MKCCFKTLNVALPHSTNIVKKTDNAAKMAISTKKSLIFFGETKKGSIFASDFTDDLCDPGGQEIF